MPRTRVVFFTKAPVTANRVEAMEALAALAPVELVGVFVEDTVHLSPWRFALRTVRRVWRGEVYLPEFIVKSARCFLPGSSTPDGALERFQTNRPIPVHRVKNVEARDVLEQVRALRHDLGVIYGHRILSERLFGIPRRGSINVHFGLLPRYAGMDYCTFWALSEGAHDVGLTIHRVDSQADHGAILLTKTIPAQGRTAPELVRRIAAMAAPALAEAVTGLVEGSLSPAAQDPARHRYWKPPTFFERIRYRRYL